MRVVWNPRGRGVSHLLARRPPPPLCSRTRTARGHPWLRCWQSVREPRSAWLRLQAPPPSTWRPASFRSRSVREPAPAQAEERSSRDTTGRAARVATNTHEGVSVFRNSSSVDGERGKLPETHMPKHEGRGHARSTILPQGWVRIRLCETWMLFIAKYSSKRWKIQHLRSAEERMEKGFRWVISEEKSAIPSPCRRTPLKLGLTGRAVQTPRLSPQHLQGTAYG